MDSPVTRKDLNDLEKRVDKKLEAFEKRIEAKINKAFDDIIDIFKAYIQHVDERFDAIDKRFDKIDKKLTALSSYRKTNEADKEVSDARIQHLEKLVANT